MSTDARPLPADDDRLGWPAKEFCRLTGIPRSSLHDMIQRRQIGYRLISDPKSTRAKVWISRKHYEQWLAGGVEAIAPDAPKERRTA